MGVAVKAHMETISTGMAMTSVSIVVQNLRDPVARVRMENTSGKI